MLEISCTEVIQEISNFIDAGVDPELRARMEAHFKMCKHCTAILDGTRNVITLAGDGRTFTLPANFSKNLYRKLSAHIEEN
jgi:hypothetical protein